jgi:hypothetical protein
MVFEENEEHKGISSSFTSDIKRIETHTSMSTEIQRDRGVSHASQTSHETSTQIVRIPDENESSNSTLNSLLQVNRISDQRMKTQQVRKTAAELEEDLKQDEIDSQTGSQLNNIT